MNSLTLLPGTKVLTEDGYTLTVQDNGSLSDGDMTFDSLEELAKEVKYEVLSE